MARTFALFTVAAIIAGAQMNPASARSFDSAVGQNRQATSERAARCFGDRPYYDYDSSGWLDDEYHPEVDCRIAPRARH